MFFPWHNRDEPLQLHSLARLSPSNMQPTSTANVARHFRSRTPPKLTSTDNPSSDAQPPIEPARQDVFICYSSEIFVGLLLCSRRGNLVWWWGDFGDVRGWSSSEKTACWERHVICCRDPSVLRALKSCSKFDLNLREERSNSVDQLDFHEFRFRSTQAR